MDLAYVLRHPDVDFFACRICREISHVPTNQNWPPSQGLAGRPRNPKETDPLEPKISVESLPRIREVTWLRRWPTAGRCASVTESFSISSSILRAYTVPLG